MKKILTISALFLLTIISCGNKNTQEKEMKKNDINTQISFSGSSTLAPVISKISTNFIEKYITWDKADSSLPVENITIYVSAGGSGAGVKAVLDDVANFGMLARDIKDTEKEKIKDLKIFTLGIDALTISVNPENKFIQLKDGNITKEEIVKIFSGEYKKWSDIDKSLPDEEIVVVTRDLSGGAHEVFQKSIMKDIPVKEGAIQAPTMGALVVKIIENKNAIGYASYGITNQNTGKLIPLKVDGVEPTDENIINKSYYISRPLIIMKKGELTKTEKLFLDFLKTEENQKIIKDMGFIPISE
ncbi:phosphate ABC transporter substrate-binding protein [Leptotrichia sp. OH3620_COT-345]|uniref:phosphate ABC transporter substrate-binding protein n=1 Tax=Leptotrichia sp. OH3620_COT-345 TaxID=2491048 RepID=UPI000F64A811|nr:phosphate ABC transporter substrate-binding protein [Leptotrichia sp. OH3620_COT-345]RRD39610.1 phosphate ABC transporter substrate-binding protein [Leptotrichia sp. OH3620_COT-345]